MSYGSDNFIKIKNKEKITIGYLQIIDNSLLTNKTAIEKLTKWRNRFKRSFCTQFNATFNRTLFWLENIVIPTKDKRLFLILDEQKKMIGNIGAANIKKDSAEIDNLLRGETGGDPQLIYFAELALINWLFFELNITNIYLHVFSNNYLTINLHSSIGFKKISSSNLYKHNKNDEIHYLLEGKDEDKAKFQYLKMSLQKKEFCKAVD